MSKLLSKDIAVIELSVLMLSNFMISIDIVLFYNVYFT